MKTTITYGTIANRNLFEKLTAYFPDVDIEKLAKVDQFHTGVTKILKAELRDEKSILDEQIKVLEIEITEADKRLLEPMGAIEKPSWLVDKVLELSFEEKNLHEQIRFSDIKSDADTKVGELTVKISENITKSLEDIEGKLNLAMSKFIKTFYEGDPVVPQIKLSETKYEFVHNEDSGTGKAYANLIALDMSFLKETYLPAIIHDLIVFSNIEDHAIEGIFKEYSSSSKQVFIAIDKLSRFKTKIQRLVKDNEFLALNANKPAFNKSWNKRAQ